MQQYFPMYFQMVTSILILLRLEKVKKVNYLWQSVPITVLTVYNQHFNNLALVLCILRTLCESWGCEVHSADCLMALLYCWHFYQTALMYCWHSLLMALSYCWHSCLMALLYCWHSCNACTLILLALLSTGTLVLTELLSDGNRVLWHSFTAFIIVCVHS